MTALFQHCAETTQRLLRAATALEREATLLQVPALEGREWFDLLRQKLLPQLTDDSFLVAAVVGGTNIGKSVIFNHLAGCKASATSPLASGTKHPVCLVPPGFEKTHDLASIFEGFELRKWRASDDALQESESHLLFWRSSPETADNLLVLDSPDIDSDAPVNWQRADHIRRSADVLIAVLTQQKYNDAAVKQFFRKAAEEDKAVILVFNQCLLPEDEQYWPIWLETFCRETGVQPEIVYLAPTDREAAEENRLPFFERRWEEGGGSRVEGPESRDPSKDLAADLSRLRFEDVKLRTLRGSLNHLLHEEHGVPAWLRELVARSGRFQSAAELLSAEKLARLDDWPAVPNAVLVNEIRTWWQGQREGWSKSVHGFYNAVGSGVTWPFRFARKKIQGEPPPPFDEYRKREWSAMLATVEKAYERLTVLGDAGNPLLEQRLRDLLGGERRTALLESLEADHAEVDFETHLRDVVVGEMQSFQEESPKLYGFFRKLDKTAAVVRPATSVVLFLTGVGPAGDAAAHIVTDSALQTVVHVAGDVTGGTLAAAVGDQALSGTAAGSLGYIEAKFRKLHAAFAAGRVKWLLERLKERLWGTLLEDLAAGASIVGTDGYREVQACLSALREQLCRSTQAVMTNDQ
ncbi:MAG: GTPase domain-containing protein [Planctomycetaceae bacterium]